MQNLSDTNECAISNMEKCSYKRSKKVKNLEQEVENIISQEESDNDDQIDFFSKTPKSTKNAKHQEVATPNVTSQAVLQEMLQTPRRSCRKSVKPTQDYDDIVSKSFRSVSRSGRKTLMLEIEEDEREQKENNEVEEETQPKWSQRKVGRSSQKRTRKSKRRNNQNKIANEQPETEQETHEAGNVESNAEVCQTKNDEQLHLEEEMPENITEKIHLEEEVPKKVTEKLDNNKESDVKNEEQEDPKAVRINVTVVECEQKPVQYPEPESKEFQELQEYLQAEINAAKIIEVDHETMPHASPAVEEHQVSNPEIIATEVNKEIQPEIIAISAFKEDEQMDELVLDESIHLVDDDSNEAIAQTDKCHIWEEEKSKEEGEKVIINKNQSIQEECDSFGPYLKAHSINIEDLGLNPLKDEEDETNEEKEEMPSLIVCDEETSTETKTNVTFDADEQQKENCPQLVKEVKEELADMETLQISDDESNPTPQKLVFPRMLLTDTEQQNLTLLSTPPPPQQVMLSTPKSANKPYRFPTPYRSRKRNFEFNSRNEHNEIQIKKESKENIEEGIQQQQTIQFNSEFLTTMEPKDIILRSIRKRSKSLCVEGSEKNHRRRSKRLRGPLETARARAQKMVSFHSPANQTAIIEDLDVLIAKSIKKLKMQQQSTVGSKNKNITTRRKRSLSLDDTMISSTSTFNISKLPRLASNIPRPCGFSSSSTSSAAHAVIAKPVARTKLPNFAAIHQKQFQRMESLHDHVARKQERSNILINSGTKIRPASSQKNVSTTNRNIPKEDKPKALKKIDLGVSASKELNKKSTKTLTKSTPTPKKIMPAVYKSLPDPRSAIFAKSMISSLNSSTVTQRKPAAVAAKAAPRVLKPAQQTKSMVDNQVKNNPSAAKTATPAKVNKPIFNLSTSVVRSVNSKMLAAGSSVVASTSKNATFAGAGMSMSNEDRTKSRLQRHMNMFKGRVQATTRKNDAAEIRNVRSNRRFELLMQHRRNLEN